MKSASYYDRKAWDAVNIGAWESAKRYRAMAAKARKIAKKKLTQHK